MRQKFRLVSLLLTAVLLMSMTLGLTSCNQGEEAQGDVDYSMVEKPIVTMVIKDYGTIKMKLYPDKAPQTVFNFISLIKNGFYDGLTFHRIISGFMVQGGDPDGNGTGGPGYCIQGEFSANGYDGNILVHTRGVVSMARSTPYDSAGSQFFIVHEEASHLDGNYAAFGKVIEGMDVVDAMAQVPVKDNNGTLADASTAPVIESITVETFGVEYPEPKKLPDV